MGRLSVYGWSSTVRFTVSTQAVPAVADALLWIIGSHGVREGIHYLDDFLILGRAGTEECSEGLERSLQLCKRLSVTVAPQKTEGPATALSFLGICLDTDEMIIKLPQEKLTRLRSLITEWKGRRTCCKRDLLSLIGQLQHACKVVWAGRSFLRRMIDLSTVASKLHHRIRLSRGFQSDLQWWDTFLVRWNGVSMMRSLHRSTPVAILTSDASGGGAVAPSQMVVNGSKSYGLSHGAPSTLR